MGRPRPTGRPRVLVAVAVEAEQIAAQARLGKGEQPDALGAGRGDEPFDGAEVVFEVAAELLGDGGNP
ncbi:hypothetical protein Phou_077470 [Phytohabitans houttuyneae]|uniref:Uncharacterized protein n=1 Tax=Phytohabitans houttuyneae TaxID=1076126 RepID=A0A6V8KP72_9ACTN|nr:hypothetical protein Phou_077470 [Phytohabitans houttuyneae]